MSLMSNRPLLLVLGLLVASQAVADPSPEIQQLMKDKLSMLDFGLIRLQAALQEELPVIYKSGSLSSIYVADAYDPDRNKINLKISAVYTPNDKSNDKDPTTACINLIGIVKKQLATRPTTGTDSSSWIVFFHHTGWTTDPTLDDNLAKILPSLLRISVKIDSSSESASCTSIYSDKSVRVEK